MKLDLSPHVGEASVIRLEQELDGRRLLEAVAQHQTGALIAQVVRPADARLDGPGSLPPAENGEADLGPEDLSLLRQFGHGLPPLRAAPPNALPFANSPG